LEKHWTEQLFIDNGEIVRSIDERVFRRAEAEVAALMRIFSSEGVKAEAKVLDLCCGIGRHSIFLAERGYNVVGVDLSPTLIARAREIASSRGIEDKAVFLEGDMRDIQSLIGAELGSFDATINMNTSIGYYSDREDEAVLTQLSRISASGGLLVIDMGNRDWIVRHFMSRDISEVADNLIQLTTRTLYLESSRLENIYEYYEKKGDSLKRIAGVKLDHRVYSLHEIVRLVSQTGWNYLRSFGGFSLEPCHLDSNRIILVAKKV